jgi:cold shock CspA family protein
MPTGRVKNFDAERGFGVVVSDDDGRDLHVRSDAVEGGATLRSGDVVEFETAESEPTQRRWNAVDVKVIREAPPENPVGRVMNAPPSWDVLEERDRQARQARRRRR